MYYNLEYLDNDVKAIKVYLIRTVLFTYFQLGTTSKLQQMKSNINDNDYEITIDILEQMNDLRVTDGMIDDIVSSMKGSRVAGEALYFLGMDWTNKNFKYEQDYLHPYDRFDSTKPIAVLMEDRSKWKVIEIDCQIFNYLKEGVMEVKNSICLVDYYNDMNDEQKAKFYQEAIIPESVSLELENFEEFMNKEKYF